MSGVRRSARVNAKSIEEVQEGSKNDRRQKRNVSDQESTPKSPVRVKRVRKKASPSDDVDATSAQPADTSPFHAQLERVRESRSIAALRLLIEEMRKANDELTTMAIDLLHHYEEERRRLHVMLKYEEQILRDERERLQREGCVDVRRAMEDFVIVGVDEVGVGPLAGPCVSGAVALHLPLFDVDEAETEAWQFGLSTLYGLNDSKKIKPAQREELAKRLDVEKQAGSVFHALGICTSQEVDKLNPRAASMEAMRRAVVALLEGPLAGRRVHLLVDYHTVPDMPSQVVGQTSMSKGDAKSQSIAAASVVAKVYRDAYMLRLHEQYPHFGFDRNAGYGTRDHLDALRQGLLCPEHRLSFGPVRAAYALLHPEEAMQDAEDEDESRTKSSTTSKVNKRTSKSKSGTAQKSKRAPSTKSKDSSPLAPRLEPNVTESVVPGKDSSSSEENATVRLGKGTNPSFSFNMPTVTGLTKWLGYGKRDVQ